MIDFKSLNIEEKDEIDRFLQESGHMAHERNFACLFIWSCHYGVESCIKDGVLYLKIELGNGKNYYYPPMGCKNFVAAISEIEEHAGDIDYTILGLSSDEVARINADLPGKMEFVEDRDNFDYIYLSENLISLKGKSYHGKRNHINKFFAEYAGRWEYKEINPATDRQLLMDFQKQWCLERDSDNQDGYQGEYCAIAKAMDFYDKLKMFGGMLFVDDKLAAFTLASPSSNDCVDILIEKAVSEVEGAYTMINNEFARRHCANFMYINREEDMGIDGLRSAKLSYKPTLLSEKYNARVKK